MISGLIIYSNVDKKKNTWFIEKCIQSFKDKGVSLIYKEEREVANYLKNNKVAFAIYRGRNYKLVQSLEEKGIRCFNNHFTNRIANNKLLTYQFLASTNIPVIPSFSSLEEVGSFPAIMKSIDGHGGEEVFFISSKEDAETFKNKNKRYVYQKFYPNNGDLRLYVLGKEVIGAVIRKNKDDFRSNYSLGGSIKAYKPSKRLIEIAIKVSTLLNADYIGVDFIKANNKWCINEIEDPVGARMLYKATNTDVVELLANYICSF